MDLSGGECYIAFRGTDLTIAGWKEDLNMSFMTVPSQKEAVAYTERTARRGMASGWADTARAATLRYMRARACALRTGAHPACVQL